MFMISLIVRAADEDIQQTTSQGVKGVVWVRDSPPDVSDGVSQVRANEFAPGAVQTQSHDRKYTNKRMY